MLRENTSKLMFPSQILVMNEHDINEFRAVMLGWLSPSYFSTKRSNSC